MLCTTHIFSILIITIKSLLGFRLFIQKDGINRHFMPFQEVHILHNFEEDFYGAEVRAVLVGFLRPMAAFNSLGLLFVFLAFFSCQVFFATYYAFFSPVQALHHLSSK